jgi:3-methyladenine DNA glycosylase AlkD
MSAEIKAIQKILQEKANPNAKASIEKFIPGIEKIYGVYKPVLNELAKQFKAGGFELVRELWDAGAFEEKILAGKLLGKIAKQNPQCALQLVESFSAEIANWAVCDTLGMQALKSIVKTHEKEIFALAKKLNRSKNLWQRRLSLVLIEWYTRNTSSHPEIKKLVKNLKNDEEYYVRKAVAWVEKNFEKGK